MKTLAYCGKNAGLLWLSVVLLVPTVVYLLVDHYEPLRIYSRIEGWNAPHDSALVSNYLFTDQLGHNVSLKSFPGKIEVVNFFFSRCPTVCPKLMSGLSRIASHYENNNEIRFLSFSVDPEYDTPETLKRYGEELGIKAAQWKLLTGKKKEVYRLARNGFHVDASEGDGGPDDFIHSEKIVLVDSKGQIRGYYSGVISTETEKLINDITKLQHAD